jgi:hypothetical protein
MAKRIEDCGRCGTQRESLRAFRPKQRQREYLCDSCFTEATENRGLSLAQIAEENARWERVYAEKFADPHYYARRPVLQSSFDAFADQMRTFCSVLR